MKTNKIFVENLQSKPSDEIGNIAKLTRFCIKMNIYPIKMNKDFSSASFNLISLRYIYFFHQFVYVLAFCRTFACFLVLNFPVLLTCAIWIWKREVFLGFIMAMNDTFFIMDFFLMALIALVMFFGYFSNFLIMSIFLPRIQVISLKRSLCFPKKEIIFRILESFLCLIATQVISLGLYLAILPKKGRLIFNNKRNNMIFFQENLKLKDLNT